MRMHTIYNIGSYILNISLFIYVYKIKGVASYKINIIITILSKAYKSK